MSNKAKGIIWGTVSAASYGLNPLFALPLYSGGLNADSVLLFRYGLAMILLGIMMKCKGESFSLKHDEMIPLIVMGLLFSVSSLALFTSYTYMDAGIASTILFVYPIMVAVLMRVFFKERVSPVGWSSLSVAILGIMLLGKTSNGQPISMFGVMLVMISSLSYAVYMIGINRSILRAMPVYKLNFYVLSVGSFVFALRTLFTTGLQVPPTPFYWLCAAGIALFPTIVSLVALTKAIHHVGSTNTAILGALEPLTAIFFGILVFHEHLTFRISVGIVLILTAVSIIISEKTISAHLKLLFHRRQAFH